MGEREFDEILARVSPDAALSRRDFLRRTAYAAGVAGAASLPAGTLLTEAAGAAAKRSRMPSPGNMPIDHFVILMMENRSFDHYFGWMSDVADAVQTISYLDGESGQQVQTRHASSMGAAEWQGCGHPDPGHGWNAGRAQLRGGFLADGSGNDEFALTYYDEGDLGFIQDAAKAYTVYDRFHCSLLGPTWPNRYYKWSGQSGGRKDNSPPVQTLGNQWDTIFDVAGRKGVSARYYNSDLPFSAVWGPRAVPWTSPIARYYADCAAGTLPNITIVDPPFRDGGGFDGNSADEHPHGDVRLGQAFMSDVVHAFLESPNYRRGALFVVYDEWGGFFDHVRPPSVPDDRQSANLDEDFGQMGFRIPAVAISPYTLKRKSYTARVDHGLHGFESILKMISYRFGFAPLTKRVAEARNIGLSFDWRSKPDFDVPDLPDPQHIASRPCEFGGGDLTEESAAAHVSDLADLEALAVRHGFRTGAGLPHELFRSPDGVRKALAASG